MEESARSVSQCTSLLGPRVPPWPGPTLCLPHHPAGWHHPAGLLPHAPMLCAWLRELAQGIGSAAQPWGAGEGMAQLDKAREIEQGCHHALGCSPAPAQRAPARRPFMAPTCAQIVLRSRAETFPAASKLRRDIPRLCDMERLVGGGKGAAEAAESRPRSRGDGGPVLKNRAARLLTCQYRPCLSSCTSAAGQAPRSNM